MTVFALATSYLMAANLSAYGYLGLTQGAAHLLEAFGDEALRATYMTRMYRGEWTGTIVRFGETAQVRELSHAARGESWDVSAEVRGKRVQFSVSPGAPHCCCISRCV